MNSNTKLSLIGEIPVEVSKLTCLTCLNKTQSSLEDGNEIFILQVAAAALITFKLKASADVTELLIMEILEGIRDILKRSISAILIKYPNSEWLNVF